MHDENHDEEGHEHNEFEIEISIEPKVDVVEPMGISQDEFEAAVGETMDRYWDDEEAQANFSLDEATISLAGKTYTLDDVAHIYLTGELNTLRDLFAAD